MPQWSNDPTNLALIARAVRAIEESRRLREALAGRRADLARTLARSRRLRDPARPGPDPMPGRN